MVSNGIVKIFQSRIKERMTIDGVTEPDSSDVEPVNYGHTLIPPINHSALGPETNSALCTERDVAMNYDRTTIQNVILVEK